MIRNNPILLSRGIRRRMERIMAKHRGSEWGMTLVKLDKLHGWLQQSERGSYERKKRPGRILFYLRSIPLYARFF